MTTPPGWMPLAALADSHLGTEGHVVSLHPLDDPARLPRLISYHQTGTLDGISFAPDAITLRLRHHWGTAEHTYPTTGRWWLESAEGTPTPVREATDQIGSRFD